MRTAVFDELILNSIKSVDADAVLNLAAGLDARPYRLQLPNSLVWIEADGTELLDAKTQVLVGEEPICRVERIAVDLADATARQRLFDQVASAHARVVVVTEGLLVYLEEAAVRSLADELSARTSMRRWVLESITPDVLKRNMRARDCSHCDGTGRPPLSTQPGLENLICYCGGVGWLP